MTSVAIGQFDFDDGGTYSGGSDGGKAHGFGVCTGPGGQGEYSGAWQFGFELSGVYTWPNGNDYAGQWMQGKRHGLGMERRGHWIYRGEWTQGFMGRYGVRQSTVSEAKYEGTWTSGLHDGYGLETYSDGGTYQGQWMKGMRHGYGVRKSALLNKAAFCRLTKVRRSSLTSIRSEVDLSEHQHLLNSGHASPTHLVDQSATAHIGFFLKGKNQEKALEQHSSFFSRQRLTTGNGLKRQCSIGDIIDERDYQRTNNQSKLVNCGLQKSNGKVDDEKAVTETYIGEWKNDKRSGFGVCERSDGLKYEGEWMENCKNGYGVTLFTDGVKEEGKYRNNVLLEPNKKMLLLRATKLRERIDLAVAAAQKAAQIALQKSDIANSRMESARSKAELAVEVVNKARLDSEKSKQQANKIIQSEPNLGQTTVTKRLSIPRHNMVDIQLDQPLTKDQQSLYQIHSNLRQNNSRQPDQHQPSDTRCSETKASTLGNSNRHQLTSVTENSLENLSDQQQANSKTRKCDTSGVNKMFAKRLGEPNYSQMSHAVSLSQFPRPLERRASEQMSVNHKEQFQTAEQRSSISGSQSALMNSYASQDLSEVDHLAEIENIFSYLAEEEKDMGEPNSPTSELQEIPQSKSLLSRPSLRYRRDVHCPKLVILNHGMDSEQKPATLKRRLTMPCIMKYGAVGPVAGRGTGVMVAAASNNLHQVSESEVIETIVIDNGVRKRLEEEMEYHPPPLPPDIDPVEEILEPPKDLPKKYRLESVKLTKKAELGSLPDVSLFRRLEGRAIPRQEANMLCQQRREELQQMKELEDQLRKRALVLRIGDFKEWCQRHQLSIFLIAVNLVLAILFSKLLS